MKYIMEVDRDVVLEDIKKDIENARQNAERTTAMLDRLDPYDSIEFIEQMDVIRKQLYETDELCSKMMGIMVSMTAMALQKFQQPEKAEIPKMTEEKKDEQE